MYFSRGKNKSKVDIGIRYLYQEYRKHAKSKNKKILSFDDYQKIFKSYVEELKECLFEGYQIKMPFHMGSLQIIKNIRKFIKPPVNWKETNRLGIRVFHEDNNTYALHWYKTKLKLLNKKKYKITANRSFNRELARRIKVEKYDYFLKK